MRPDHCSDMFQGLSEGGWAALRVGSRDHLNSAGPVEEAALVTRQDQVEETPERKGEGRGEAEAEIALVKLALCLEVKA